MPEPHLHTNKLVNDAIITDIREKRNQKTQPVERYPEGTIIRFKLKHQSKKLTYAALYAGGRWWTTSTFQASNATGVTSIMSDDQMVSLLASDHVKWAELGTEFTRI